MGTIDRMNALVLTLATIVGLVLGVVIWWFGRSLLAAVSAAMALIALVALALPWDVVPPTPPVSTRAAAPPPAPTSFLGPTLAMLESDRPIEVPADGYVGSDSCLECHPDNHATWHASYHRTMTQVASPDIVLGNFQNVRVVAHGREYLLQQHGDVCWADMHDPMLPVSDSSRVTVPIVMTTGSHHMQAYWYGTGTGRVTGLLPIVHLNETDEWIPVSASFLKPESDGLPGEVGRWNLVCSKCHSTHRRERPRPGTDVVWDTQAAEFGISCEACHGPAEQHIKYQRRIEEINDGKIENSLADKQDPIVNPLSLSHVRSTQVCGQCHSVRSSTEDEAKHRELGHGYRPGDDLTETHLIWERDSEETREFLSKGTLGMSSEYALSRVYYRDGVVRVAGREYNGLIASACHQHGEMSCLSCHQMHKSESDPRTLSAWANDQLRPAALDDGACLQCHQQNEYGTSHTHHQSGSVGARCYNCHMPHTTYGLLKAIRSHTISSPDVGKDLYASRPNACNLCHLDKTLAWSAEHLQSWYGIDPPQLDDDQRKVAASLLWILNGDAAERALVSWSMGWPDALSTSGSDWQVPFLSQLLNDDYAAIRFIARRSIQALPGFANVKFNDFTNDSAREDVFHRIQNRWRENYQSDQPNRPHLLLRDNQIQVDIAARLMEERDNTHINLAE
jgi:hypothetical protein